ncbi:hypothetical protein [Parendozoicomonas haliclonae]|uniref:Uncharacterized protein n=1 Tax=Parendozoicomonas haliclonae TaxID=1960125 RepID=A0A1X7ANU9_9GAMM|nr:hypothetical protein [Parendozoicomonas haliclonae]SMA49778.1 hypothetical protein EHSB41UT_03567 [Parendozoicomonas haliclonae]
MRDASISPESGNTGYTTSRYLNQRQLSALTRIGDIFVPGGQGFQSFSESGSLYNVDIVLAPTPKDDLVAMKWVLTIFSVFNTKVLGWLLNQLDKAGQAMPAWADLLGSQLRLLVFGLRGIIFSLYYSGQGSPYHPNRVYEVMDYQVHCQPDSVPSSNTTDIHQAQPGMES